MRFFLFFIYMFRSIIILAYIFHSASFFRPFVRKCITLEAIKIMDHDMENKTIYDKFEYYSLIGDRKKQMEYFRKIGLLNNHSKIKD